MKDLDYYMNLNYKIEVMADKYDGGYVLSCPELDGFANIEDARKCWFEACIESGTEIPEPSSIDDYSGQFKLRIPKSLHKELAQKSRQEGISMNQYCVYLLSHGIGK